MIHTSQDDKNKAKNVTYNDTSSDPLDMTTIAMIYAVTQVSFENLIKETQP